MGGKRNLILTDCDPDEVITFKNGCEAASGLSFEIVSNVSNLNHGNAWKRLKRYFSYFYFPFSIFLKRKELGVVVGWQQFHAINFAFFSRLFRTGNCVKTVAVNFTYKSKRGLVGKLYRRYMGYAVSSPYLYRIHVLSHQYAADMSREFGVDMSRFIVTPFGTPDNYGVWKNLICEDHDFVLALGRSNRDFDILVKMWKHPLLQSSRLIIISDTWNPSGELPSNVKHLNNVKGDASLPYISNCKVSIVTLIDPKLCSGDTVLLNSMMMGKPVVISSPSTLSEMYIDDGVNGVCISGDIDDAAEKVSAILNDDSLYQSLAHNARMSYLGKFSRTSMGENIMKSMGNA